MLKRSLRGYSKIHKYKLRVRERSILSFASFCFQARAPEVQTKSECDKSLLPEIWVMGVIALYGNTLHSWILSPFWKQAGAAVFNIFKTVHLKGYLRTSRRSSFPPFANVARSRVQVSINASHWMMSLHSHNINSVAFGKNSSQFYWLLVNKFCLGDICV